MSHWEKQQMHNAEIVKEFEAAEAILRGHFVLSSGLHSDTYLQCARVLMDPARANRLCYALADKIRAAGVHADCVIAPAMGGVVVGYEMGRQLGLNTMFCERQDGCFALRRGFGIEKGARVLLVEDVVTTGKSSLEAVKCIESHGGEVVAEASLVDRSGGRHSLPFPLISLLTLDVKTYSDADLPAELAAIEITKPGSRWLKA
jgi:orotate phosphoribosyltransferase